MMMSGRGSRNPFTAAQWQELEHQALIFKYMASGIPIPNDLLLPIRRSFLLDSNPSATPSLAFPHHLPIGWGSYQLGYGRKAEDPEPWRCRRTDGKKWRCSKEAYPDSKYCERHMHRGKNRSRKPVEMSLASLPTTHHSLYSTPPPHPSPSPPPLSISTPDSSHSNIFFPFSSSKSSNSATHGNYYSSESNKDYCRYGLGMKDVDEYSFLSETSGAARESPWPKLGSGGLNSGYEDDGKQHCFVLGADFKLEKPGKMEREEVPLRHFFDEWPGKSRDSPSWISLDDQSSSGTQLSMSSSYYHDE